MDIIITSLVGVLTAAVGSGTTWVLARKKYKSEVESNNIKNMEESLQFYMTLSADNQKQLKEYQKNFEEISQQNAALLDSNHKITEENFRLSQEVKRLTEKVELMESLIKTIANGRTKTNKKS